MMCPVATSRGLPGGGSKQSGVLPARALGSAWVAMLVPLASAWSHAYTWQQGALAQGGDVFQNEMTLDDAKSQCNSHPECCGVTFESPDKLPAGPLKMFLKSDCHPNGDVKWNTYIRGQELTEPWAYAVLSVCGLIGTYIGLGTVHGWLVRGQRGIDACPNRNELLALWGLMQDGASFATGGMTIQSDPSYGRIPDVGGASSRGHKSSKKSSKHKSSSRR